MNGTIKSDTFYVWDNWGYVNQKGEWHIYAQYCEKSLCGLPEDRYWNARIQHFVSSDQGESFVNVGTAINISQDPSQFDAFNIWSGCAYELDTGKVISLYTGLARGSKRLKGHRRYTLQSIGGAISTDGGASFKKIHEPLISPIRDYEKMKELGYYLGPKSTLGEIDDPDGTFMCLRDPEVFVDDAGIHVLFACKVKCTETQNDIRNGVGHAIISDGDSLTLEIKEPIFIAKETDYNQLELPGLFKSNGRYYLIVSTTKLEYIGQPDTDAMKTVRLYYTDKLDGREWEPFGDCGRHIILNSKRDGIYGPKILHNHMIEGLHCFRPFVVGETFAPRSIGIKLETQMAKVIFL